jgi:fumarate reductase subunit C
VNATKPPSVAVREILAAVSVAVSVVKLVCRIITALAGNADLAAHCSVYANDVDAVLNLVSAVLELLKLIDYWNSREQIKNK